MTTAIGGWFEHENLTRQCECQDRLPNRVKLPQQSAPTHEAAVSLPSLQRAGEKHIKSLSHGAFRWCPGPPLHICEGRATSPFVIEVSYEETSYAVACRCAPCKRRRRRNRPRLRPNFAS